MKRKEFLSALGGSAALSLLRPLHGAETKKPNILYVFCDQLRACDLGCTGNPQVKTPTLDRLAAEGVLMAQCYSVSPVCSPYRGQLMTGRYPWKNGVDRNGAALTPGQKFLPEILKENGYETGYIGKWHLSGLRDDSDFVPKDRRAGWEYWVGVNGGKKPDQASYYTEEGKQVPIEGMEPDFQVEKAAEFIKQPRQKPWCLMLSFNPPHGGRAPEAFNTYREVALRANVPAEQAGEAKRMLGQYFALITWMDSEVAKLMKILEEQGASHNTIVVFTSDHGNMIGSQGTDRKLRPWDESARVPLIIRHPAGLAPGKKCEAMISSVDLMPTLLGLAGIRAPEGIDGRDFTPAVRGVDMPGTDATYLSCKGINPEGPGFDWRAVRTPDWLYAVHKNGDWLLYDVKNDPFQLKNLSTDPAHEATRARLRAMLEDFRVKTGDDGALEVGRTLPAPGALHSPDPQPEKHRGGGEDGKREKKNKKEK